MNRNTHELSPVSTISFEADERGVQALRIGAMLDHKLRLESVDAQSAAHLIATITGLLSTPRPELELRFPHLRHPGLVDEDEQQSLAHSMLAAMEIMGGKEYSSQDLPTPQGRGALFMNAPLNLLHVGPQPDRPDFAHRWPARHLVASGLFGLVARLTINHVGEMRDLRIFGNRITQTRRVITGFRNGERVADSTHGGLAACRAFAGEACAKAAELAAYPGTRVDIRRITERQLTGDLLGDLGKIIIGTMPGYATRRHLPRSETIYSSYTPDLA